jgi:hypothetical protein
MRLPMNNHSPIRRRKNKEPEKTYLYKEKESYWSIIEDTAYNNGMSIADFMRESVRRNVKTYNKVASL